MAGMTRLPAAVPGSLACHCPEMNEVSRTEATTTPTKTMNVTGCVQQRSATVSRPVTPHYPQRLTAARAAQSPSAARCHVTHSTCQHKLSFSTYQTRRHYLIATPIKCLGGRSSTRTRTPIGCTVNQSSEIPLLLAKSYA